MCVYYNYCLSLMFVSVNALRNEVLRLEKKCRRLKQSLKNSRLDKKFGRKSKYFFRK